MYQRLSAHLTSVEFLSDLRDISSSKISSSLIEENAASTIVKLTMTRSESLSK
jgi:hypothetical protein